MYPRVSSYAAICGRSPVASIGQATSGAPALRDRKDPPLAAGVPTPAENAAEHEARKQHASDLLDEANDESFPASDSASPFVPAVGSMSIEEGERAQAADAPLKNQGDAIDSME